MSWSLYAEGSLEDVHKAIDAEKTTPPSIKWYVRDGLGGLVKRYGTEVRVKLAAYGHVCDSADSYEVTSATIDLRPLIVETAM